MYQFIETIKIKNGIIKNLSYHQRRVDYTIHRFFNSKPFSIKKTLLKIPKSGTFKARIIYGKKISKIEILPYRFNKKAKFVFDNTDMEYKYKFLQRDLLKADTIFLKNGYITDHAVANVAFFDGKNWLTPIIPLLKGTTRARLIDARVLKLSLITKDTFKNCQKIALINALKGFCIVEER
jgi:4-amino-4-deoxychorismate lyase